MARVILNLCDVKPCNLPARREFLVNGERIFVCGENCFVRYWSREYSSWQQAPYLLEATSHSVDSLLFQQTGELPNDFSERGVLKNHPDSRISVFAKR